MRPVLTILCALAAIPTMGTTYAFAQTAIDDPMSVAKAINSVALNKQATNGRSITSQRSLPSTAVQPSSTNIFTQKYGENTAIVEKIAADLELTFGLPKTKRGDVKLWEVKNPQYRFGQAETVTIMLGPNKTGENELIIDQRGASSRLAIEQNQSIIEPRPQTPIPNRFRRSLAVD